MTDILAPAPTRATHGAGDRAPSTAQTPSAAHAHRSGVIALAFSAIGVAFGDIGTSPLYALQTVFSIDHGAVHPTPSNVYGIISLIFWSITLIVSAKYISVVMRADNNGEGGVLSLSALASRTLASLRGSSSRKRAAMLILVGVLGSSLFYGDSLITPSISVLSAVEGLNVAAPGLHSFVLPIAIGILVILFAVQRFGTGKVGALFGPVMVVWFATLAATGARVIAQHPAALKGLSPVYAAKFVMSHPGVAFLAMGAVVLVLTGAEALYADMGHFGRKPITLAWFALAFPALTLNYLGQAALILHNPGTVSSPFFLMMPRWAQMPMVALATVATVIASQAVISGAFSVTRNAMQLGFIPPLTVRQTSEREGGQVYLPAVNAALLAGVLTLTLVFQSSTRLATAYGVATTTTFLINTTLLLTYARLGWRWSWPKIAAAAVVLYSVELVFCASNMVKLASGGWLPLLIAALTFTVMTAWHSGRAHLTATRVGREGSLAEFIADVHRQDVARVPGTAVFPHPTKETTPLALRALVQHNRVLHEHVIVVSARAENVPHVPADERISVDDLGYSDDGIFHIAARFGFSDSPDIPSVVEQAVNSGLLPEASDIDLDGASYFISRATIRSAPHHRGVARWRKLLFVTLAHNAADPTSYFNLPIDQTVSMGSHIDI